MSCPDGPILTLERCPVCDGAAATKVSRYNRFILFDRSPDKAAAVYNYSLCHQCGVVYAARRPAGERHRWLLGHFEEALGRARDATPRQGKYAIASAPLTDERRRHLTQLASRGVFVSSHDGVSRKDYLPALARDRLAMSPHAELLGTLLELDAPRVLEIRARLGSLCAILQRLYRADCHAITIFETQRFLIEQVYGIPAAWPLDFDHFTVPFEGTFDLIVSNHMLTHAVRPREFLGTVRERLRPGGHLYVYHEALDAEFLTRGKSMFHTLNPFHMQTFDQASLVRALEANGFTVTFCHLEGDMLCVLARRSADPVPSWSPMPERERARRRSLYRAANDAAILRVPEHLRTPFREEWAAVLERGVAAGIASVRKDGRVKVLLRDTSRSGDEADG